MMDSCSCGQPKTLGQLLDGYSASVTGEALPQGFSKQLFGPVYNTSLCDLYSSSSEEGFAGHCEVNSPAPLTVNILPCHLRWLLVALTHWSSDLDTFPCQGLHSELLDALSLPACASCWDPLDRGQCQGGLVSLPGRSHWPTEDPVAHRCWQISAATSRAGAA